MLGAGKEFLSPFNSSTTHWHVLLRLALLAILESLLAGYWHTEVLVLHFAMGYEIGISSLADTP